MYGSPAEGLSFFAFFCEGRAKRIMAKIDELKKCAADTLDRVVSSEEEFRLFLDTGANLFNYSLTDRLLIYAHKPETTMAASFEDWRDKAGCHVKRGEKGIALFSENGNSVRYVFSDKSVEPDEGCSMPKRWRFREECAPYVVKSLRENIKAREFDGELYDQILILADAACEEWLKEHIREDQRREFGDFFKSVVAFEIFKRLGIGTEDIEDYLNFSALHRFRSFRAVACLNKGIEAVEKPFLQQVRRAVIRFDRLSSKAPEQIGGVRRRRASEDNPVNGQGNERSEGQEVNDKSTGKKGERGDDNRESDRIRDTSAGVSEKSLQRDVPGAALDWGPLGAYLRDTEGSRGAAREAGSGESKEARGDGGVKEAGRGGVDQAGESRGGGSEGAGAERADLYESGAGRDGGSLRGGVDIAGGGIQTDAAGRPEREGDDVSVVAFGNYRITDDSPLGGGAKEKFKRNLDAIRLLKRIEDEGRGATLQEQEILSRYVGWGGLADAFSDKEAWKTERRELEGALTAEEYAAARATTLDAFYTPPAVIREIYEALKRFGFEGGNVLEPSCGIGNFLGMMPPEMSAASRVYAVEKDSISGRIARLLYPEARVEITGFEDTGYPDQFFDVAVGNVPFGETVIYDRRYAKENFLIHDYFIAKLLDQLRPGGIAAVITSSGTMDKENGRAREDFARKAELLGAVRLPNNTFLKNAGTEVTADILFFQKRDRLAAALPLWVGTEELNEGIRVNRYYVENPSMLLGEMQVISGRFGPTQTLSPFKDRELPSLLKEALPKINGQITEIEADGPEEGESDGEILSADTDIPNFSYTVRNGEIFYRANSILQKQEGLSEKTKQRIEGLIPVRDCVRELLSLQIDPEVSEEEISQKQRELNRLYDGYVNTASLFGTLNGRKVKNYICTQGNSSAFGKDASYPLLTSLELLDEDGNVTGKSDIFTKRTIARPEVITHVDTAADALPVSLNEKGYVDLPYMAHLTGKSEGDIIYDLQGVIYYEPSQERYVTAEEYLSGNVREKLRIAQRLVQEGRTEFAVNAEALKRVLPPWVSASEIEVRLGATWFPVDYVRQFMKEVLQTPEKLFDGGRLAVNYSQITGKWSITGKGLDKSAVVLTEYGTARKNAYEILECTLNLGTPKVYDYDRDGNVHLNQKETVLAGQMQDKLSQAFRDWIFHAPDRREELERLYNEKFNAIRPREYDGSYLTFPGINPDIKLFDHQKNAIAHVLHGDNTLLAHVVGAGKTFEMVAAAMESKRLGLCHKSLITVPDYLTEQWGADFMRLYPGARILVAQKRDFEGRNRKRFCSRIATGEYDAVIMGHTQFGKIPISREREAAILNEQIEETAAAVSELKAQNGERFTVKEMEKLLRRLKEKVERLNDTPRDDAVTFEELGVDRLFVDESHLFKNLQTTTKLSRVAGGSTSASKRAQDMFNKCLYMDEITGGKGIVFATGTPIANSMTEMYTIMRYLMHGKLKEYGIGLFDEWAADFGQTVSAIELSPEGKGYRQKTRFARFYNLPELMSIFRTFADVKTADMLALDVPEAEYTDVALPVSEIQKGMVDELVERAKAVRDKRVRPEEDNMLSVTNDGRKVALDERLFDPSYPADPYSKAEACAEKACEIWKETAKEKGAQLIFLDLSTPKTDKSYSDTENTENAENEIRQDGFTVYGEIKRLLIEKGVPEKEIAFIHEAKTDLQKATLFAKVRSGEVRFLLGSTGKMGAGMNVQTRLAAMHHLDAPWRPSDIEQREGRIIRQGNMYDKVKIFRYLKQGSFDSYMWQTLKNKQAFISQIMTSRTPVRAADDIDEMTLKYSEVLALTVDNPLIKEKMELDIEMEKLRTERAVFIQNQYRLQDLACKSLPASMKTAECRIRGLQADIETVKKADQELASRGKEFLMMVGKREYTERKEAGEALMQEAFGIRKGEAIKTGSYRGLEVSIEKGFLDDLFRFALSGEITHHVEAGTNALGNIARLDNAIENLERKRNEEEAKAEKLKQDYQTVLGQLNAVFPKEEDFKRKSARLAELEMELSLDREESVVLEDGGEPEGGVNGEDVFKETRGKDGTVTIRITDYQAKYQFAGIPKKTEAFPDEYEAVKKGLLNSVEEMERRLGEVPSFKSFAEDVRQMGTAKEMTGKQKLTGEQVCYMLDRAYELLDALMEDPLMEESLKDLRTTGILKCKKQEDGSYMVKGYRDEEIPIPRDSMVTKGYVIPRESTFSGFLQDVRNACLPVILQEPDKYREDEELIKEAVAHGCEKLSRELGGDIRISFNGKENTIHSTIDKEEGLYAFLAGESRSSDYPAGDAPAAFDRIREVHDRIEAVKNEMTICEELSGLKDKIWRLKDGYHQGVYTDGRVMMSVFKTVLNDVKSRATYRQAYGTECSMLIGAEIMGRWNEAGLNRYYYGNDPSEEMIEAVFRLFDDVFSLAEGEQGVDFNEEAKKVSEPSQWEMYEAVGLER